MPLRCWARLQREGTGEEEAGRITTHLCGPGPHSSHSRRGKGREDVHPGCPRGQGVEKLQSSLLEGRWVSICLTTQEQNGGRGTGMGIPGPGGRGRFGLPHRKPKVATAGATEAAPTTPPATRPTLGVHEFASSIPDATRDVPCWAGTHQWPRREILCVPLCVSVHRGTEAVKGLRVGTQGVSGCVCMAERACGQWPCTQAQTCMRVCGRGSEGALWTWVCTPGSKCAQGGDLFLCEGVTHGLGRP